MTTMTMFNPSQSHLTSYGFSQ